MTVATMSAAAPCVKWAGGKRYLVPEILKRMPARIKTYYEPFFGGGAVFFALANEGRFERAVISDSNEELMRAYAAIANQTTAVIKALKEHVYSEEHYYRVRSLDPISLAPPARAARFIYLNRVCFNGLYRVNKKGSFNVPFGRYTNPTICDEEGLRAAARVLKGTAKGALDFEAATLTAKRGDVVYFDPPYVPSSETSDFTAYTVGGFGADQHERLRDVAKRLSEKGALVLLSNSDTPLVRRLYKGFRIERVEAPRRVNSRGDGRGNVAELLISAK
jgi:DNA adenine methylase